MLKFVSLAVHYLTNIYGCSSQKHGILQREIGPSAAEHIQHARQPPRHFVKVAWMASVAKPDRDLSGRTVRRSSYITATKPATKEHWRRLTFKPGVSPRGNASHVF